MDSSRWALVNPTTGLFYWSWRYDSEVTLDDATLFNSKKAALRSAAKSRTEWVPKQLRLVPVDGT